MRLVLALGVLAMLAGCQIIYKLPTRQGNVIEQKQLDQLKLGMSREQVVYLMGTPLAASPFRTDRWDYIGYYKSPRGKVSERTVTLYFSDDTLAEMEGVEPVRGTAGIENPDLKTVIGEEKQAASQDARDADAEKHESGVVITPQ
jgi:outer membrane protein assembly factor BamE